MQQTPNNDPEEISGVLSWVNQLGTSAERFFSRIYRGVDQQRQGNDPTRRRQTLQQKIETARRISEQNKQLKRYLEKRRIEIDRMQGILAALPEGIVMQDLEGKVVFVNRAARELLGNQKHFWSTEIGSLFDAYRDVTTLQTEIVPFGEPEKVTINNRILGAQVAGVANNDGQRVGTMIVLRDVTRDALSDRLKDQFVTAISHELKTPMTVIKGMSEVLINQSDEQPPDRALLETLSRNVDILDRMVIELLDVAEMSAGTFSIREDRLHIESIIWCVVNGIAPEVKKKRMEILVQLRNIEQLMMLGDEQHLRWALGHLLQNAIHYTEAGGRIRVSAGIDPENPANMTIEVRDTGVGITDKDMPHVFERFYRGKARSSSGKLLDPRGLGQGLFIARTVTEAHNGYLTASSMSGQGSIFTLVLPRS